MTKKVFVLVLILMLITIAIIGCRILNPGGPDTLPQEEDSIPIRETGTRTYCFFGLDSLTENSAGNNDVTMIIYTDNDLEDVKTVAIYSNTLMVIDCFDKVGTAYSNGAGHAVGMLEKNLDINIDGYMAAELSVVIDMIDALGGITVNIPEEKVESTNACIKELNSLYGKNAAAVSAGSQNLNGTQAVGYTKIKYKDGGKAQRSLLSYISEKYRSADKATQKKVIDIFNSGCATNMSEKEMSAMTDAFAAYNVSAEEIYPKYNTSLSTGKLGNCITADDLVRNVTWLHEFLYGNTGYQPPERFSDEIETTTDTD